MVLGIDHVTIVVPDLVEARRFFSLLGFEETITAVASGEEISRYMAIDGWEADHLTLTLGGAGSGQQVQLLSFHHPALGPDDTPGRLDRLGLNHLCFTVEDLDATTAMMAEHGFDTRSDVLDYHGRRLVFLDGPGRVVIELAEYRPA